jgi:nuclear factor NF-kappa-B p105 subunit
LYYAVNVNAEKLPPFLEIVEEPTDKPFRFRYKSEMHGTHGSLMGARTERSKRTYPTVALRNFNFAKAIIRCSLYQVPKKNGERSPHSHKLVIRKGDIEQNDPHDIEVSSQNDFTAW